MGWEGLLVTAGAAGDVGAEGGAAQVGAAATTGKWYCYCRDAIVWLTTQGLCEFQ